jgi:glucose-1-phosphatase
MHKAIIFDLGKVLVHFDFRIAYRAMAPFCAHAPESIPKLLSGTGLVERYETGLIESPDFVAEISRILDLRVEYGEFRSIFCSIFSDVLIPESMLESLARRYRLILLSNTNALHVEVLREKYGHLLRHFHHKVLSHEVHAMKPQPEIYRAAIDAAGCRPEECFYTDDIAQFVEGARTLGIDAVRFESCAQIERELRHRGIEW